MNSRNTKGKIQEYNEALETFSNPTNFQTYDRRQDTRVARDVYQLFDEALSKAQTDKHGEIIAPIDPTVTGILLRYYGNGEHATYKELNGIITMAPQYKSDTGFFFDKDHCSANIRDIDGTLCSFCR
jgi:hypothetical protein